MKYASTRKKEVVDYRLAQLSTLIYSLLRARAVQEFNGERWFGVHPLVVDLLGAQGEEIERLANESFKGGTI